MGKTFGFLKTRLRCLGESCDILWCSPASGCRGFLAPGTVPSTMLPGRAIVFTGRGEISVTCKRPTGGTGWKLRTLWALSRWRHNHTRASSGQALLQQGCRGRAVENLSLPSAPGPVPTGFAKGALEILISMPWVRTGTPREKCWYHYFY